jgi:hypothetical protein
VVFGSDHDEVNLALPSVAGFCKFIFNSCSFITIVAVDDVMCCNDDDEGEEDDEDEEEEEEEEEEVGKMAVGAAEASQTQHAGEDASVAALRELVEQHEINTLYPPLDGTAFYATICRINHSCDPNVRVTYINASPSASGTVTATAEGSSAATAVPAAGTAGCLLARLVALKPIAPGEELVQSYIDQFAPFATRQKALLDYGFVCRCTKCIAEGSIGKA